MYDCTIVISTFGDEKWIETAEKRAIPSAESFSLPVVVNHGETLHDTRNKGLWEVETEYVCHLDADDELYPGFFDRIFEVEGDLRPPSVKYIPPGIVAMPKVVGHRHICKPDCLLYGNWLVVGTVAKTQLLKDVGGWKEWGNFEDYDLWQRAWLAGAVITAVPDAVYVAYTDPNGRCRSTSQRESMKIQRRICETNMPGKDFSWLKW